MADRALTAARQGMTLRSAAILVGSVAIASALSVAAQETDHPVTAANIFIVTVLLNGTLDGLAQGLIAAVAVSIIYACFIRFPIILHGFDVVDDVFPIVALTLTAIISGVISGKLRSRVVSTERARLRLGKLLDYSRQLHSAMSLEEIAAQLVAAMTDGGARARCIATIESQHDFKDRERWNEAVQAKDSEQPASHGSSAPQPDELADEGAVVGLTIMAIERIELLEEIATAEAAIRSDKLKTALISSLSHDLRTPLAAIGTAASNLERLGAAMDDAERASMVETIQQQCSRLLDFTTKSMSLGRIEGGLTGEDMDIVDLEDAIHGAIAAVRPISDSLRILRRIDSVGVFTRASPLLLEQALANVIENALHYAPSETLITVTLSRAGERATIAIADDGPGISEADLPRVFERFYRGGNAAGLPGHGIGLSIVKAFTDAMGGEVELISPIRPTGGTEVRIVLPALDIALATEEADFG